MAVKCDGVAKNAVMDPDKDDGGTLRDAVLTEFKNQNSTKYVDCAAVKANWLGKSYRKKRVESLVVWLRNKAAADHLLQRETAVFGASKAFCSEFVRLDDPNLCYNCNKDGHKQIICSNATQCGVCSGTHNTRKCNRSFYYKCPACGKVEHTVFDKRCRLRPRHHQVSDKVGETQKSAEQTRRRPRAATCDRVGYLGKASIWPSATSGDAGGDAAVKGRRCASYDDGHVRTWMSQNCNLKFADPRSAFT